MPTMTLRCSGFGCGRGLVLNAPRRGSFSSMAIPAYEAGWRLVGDRWFCSEDCVASAARDVTPVEAMPLLGCR